MQSDDIEEQRIPHTIPGPPQLPPLIKGQKIKSGPYMITVTDEMVAHRERENLELYKAWVREQRRRNMLPQDDANEFIGDFKDIIVRRSFVRKVFCLLTLQLIFTILVISIFMFIDDAQKFMIVHWYLWIVAMVLFIVSYCAVACSVHARRTPPFNYICLCLLTLAMSYLSAFVSVFYSIEVILIVMGMTAAVTTIIALVATFSRYLYFDVQTIMGGRRIELNPDEVVFATTQIYVDIVLLYQYLLMFMGFFQQ
ncbi:PREDICTED: protein lifeguard 1-like isoform X2 [Wasmannia auropunctata]|uniref:protein lifeguard 1-like isoform X2 n=1 Tax=Wasmannia auropunctata TaxID=64793 RepID=UPI0005F07A48|nr:PREDICTED: protein lifeguard 1-like isoform X2 [Wasmannia auropunctata]